MQLIRLMQVTGEKAIYVNPQCKLEFSHFCSTIAHASIVTRYIVGYKREESDALLKFLYDHIALSQDIQARVKWAPGTVVVWDVSISFPIIGKTLQANSDFH